MNLTPFAIYMYRFNWYLNFFNLFLKWLVMDHNVIIFVVQLTIVVPWGLDKMASIVCQEKLVHRMFKTFRLGVEVFVVSLSMCEPPLPKLLSLQKAIVVQ